MKQSSFRAVVLGIATVLLAACAAMPGAPGHITETTSTFDGSVQLSMEPAFVFRHADGFSGSDLRLGLLWRSTMKSGELVLIAYVDGARIFAPGKSLLFNIDGQIVGLESIDQLTGIAFKPGSYEVVYIPGGNVSSKRYLLDRSFLSRLLSAKDVRVRLDFDRSFVEGVFSDDTMSSAKPAFIEFSKKLEGRAKQNGV